MPVVPVVRQIATLLEYIFAHKLLYKFHEIDWRSKLPIFWILTYSYLSRSAQRDILTSSSYNEVWDLVSNLLHEEYHEKNDVIRETKEKREKRRAELNPRAAHNLIQQDLAQYEVPLEKEMELVHKRRAMEELDQARRMGPNFTDFREFGEAMIDQINAWFESFGDDKKLVVQAAVLLWESYDKYHDGHLNYSNMDILRDAKNAMRESLGESPSEDDDNDIQTVDEDEPVMPKTKRAIDKWKKKNAISRTKKAKTTDKRKDPMSGRPFKDTDFLDNPIFFTDAAGGYNKRGIPINLSRKAPKIKRSADPFDPVLLPDKPKGVRIISKRQALLDRLRELSPSAKVMAQEVKQAKKEHVYLGSKANAIFDGLAQGATEGVTELGNAVLNGFSSDPAAISSLLALGPGLYGLYKLHSFLSELHAAAAQKFKSDQ